MVVPMHSRAPASGSSCAGDASATGCTRHAGHHIEAHCRVWLSQVIGETATDLDGRFATVRSRESNLGNWVADIWRAGARADIALLNSGTLRSDCIHPAGQLTMKVAPGWLTSGCLPTRPIFQCIPLAETHLQHSGVTGRTLPSAAASVAREGVCTASSKLDAAW